MTTELVLVCVALDSRLIQLDMLQPTSTRRLRPSFLHLLLHPHHLTHPPRGHRSLEAGVLLGYRSCHRDRSSDVLAVIEHSPICPNRSSSSGPSRGRLGSGYAHLAEWAQS